MTELKKRKIEKLNVIKKVLIGECTKKEASDFLGLTIRQINRLLIKFKGKYYIPIDTETGEIMSFE